MPKISPQVIQYLRCPETESSLSELTEEQVTVLNQAIEQKQVFDRIGKVVVEPVEGGLINASGSWIYLIRAGIVCLIQDHAVAAKSLEQENE